MSILFINGSPNKTGNTAVLAANLLRGKDYKTLNLTDYTIGAYGQDLPGDGLDAGGRRVHHAALCYALRHDLWRHGDEPGRSSPAEPGGVRYSIAH